MPRESIVPVDPLRLIDLLWQPSTRVGRSGATVSSIVTAAIDIADASGLAAVTMRAVADRVGVAPMTLYGYLPGKAELVELMIDACIGRAHDPQPLPQAGQGLPEAVLQIGEQVYRHTVEHPWVVDAPDARPVLGPGICRVYEAQLQALDGHGLGDLELDAMVTAIRHLANGSARWAAGLEAARTADGQTDEQWWSAVEPRLRTAMGGEQFPLSARVGATLASAGEPLISLRTALTALAAGFQVDPA
ncbi:TetR/AcrR family transcriptional regulator [Dermacoccaceae bacterium W4C1]